jgi:hypothetical protein
VIQTRLLGSSLRNEVRDLHLRSLPAELTRSVSAVVLLIAGITFLASLMLAAFGSFAALRIAHGYGSAGERASPAQPLASTAPKRTPDGSADRIILVPSDPPVVASSDPTENEPDLKPGNMDSAAPRAAELGGSAEEKPPGSARAAATGSPEVLGGGSAMPAPGAAAAGDPTRSIDSVAVVPPRGEITAVAPQYAKRHHAVKHHAAPKRVRRIARRPAYPTAAASPFQPMFSSP